MLTRLSPHLLTWNEIHGASRNQAYPWNSFLAHDDQAQVRVMIDPLPLSDAEVKQMEDIGVPTHIVLTCSYHERSSSQLKKKWGCEVLLFENYVQEAEIKFDDTFQDRDILWNFLEVVRVPDVRHREEVSFCLIPNGALIVGDLLSGGRKDCAIADGELGFKDPAYLVDLAKARLSLKTLLHLEFDALCFGHGKPILSKAKDVLRRFVECDATWEEVKQRREERFRLNPELRNLHRT